MLLIAQCRTIFAASAVLVLAGCAVGSEPAVTHAALPASLPATVSLHVVGPEGETAPVASRRFLTLLDAAMTARGIAAGQGGYRIEVALARRPASAGAAQEAGDTVTWLAAVRKKRWLESCKPDVIEVTLTGFAQGQTAQQPSYRAAGGFLACQPGEEQMRRLAGLFAEDFSQR